MGVAVCWTSVGVDWDHIMSTIIPDISIIIGKPIESYKTNKILSSTLTWVEQMLQSYIIHLVTKLNVNELRNI